MHFSSTKSFIANYCLLTVIVNLNEIFIQPALNFVKFFLQVLVKEEDRLATVIASINYDVSIVPRAAFLRAANGDIYANRSFEGRLFDCFSS